MIEFFRQFSESFRLAFGAAAVAALGLWAIIYYLTYAVRSQILGETVWCGNAGNRSAALTFDDGPSPDTLEILDILKNENVKATFFLVGKNVEKYPEIARRIAREGHQIGNHSYSHPVYLFCTPNKTRRELEKTQEIIKTTTGVEPKLARPPYGVRSPAYFAAARELGLRTIQWSDSGLDWRNISAEKIARNVLETAQSDSIILLHDGDGAGKSDRRRTTKAIPLILKGLKEKGLRVAALAEIRPEIYGTQSDSRLFSQSFDGEKQV